MYKYWHPADHAHLEKLEAIYHTLPGDGNYDIPLIVRLMENPESWISFPGAISLYNHDMLHVVLDCGIRNFEEAFVVGFVMGNNIKTRNWHKALFKFIARNFYPINYRFSEHDEECYDLGFSFGQKTRYKNVNKVNFNLYLDEKVDKIRSNLKIDKNLLRAYRQKREGNFLIQ